jgi:hypothetical protein
LAIGGDEITTVAASIGPTVEGDRRGIHPLIRRTPIMVSP